MATPPIPGWEQYDIAKAMLGTAADIPAHSDDTNPAAREVIAEAQVHISMAIYEALADVAAELALIRRQRED